MSLPTEEEFKNSKKIDKCDMPKNWKIKKEEVKNENNK